MQSDERRSAERDLAEIRALMERAGRFSHLSATAAFVAGGLALGGSALSARFGATFSDSAPVPPLAAVWGSVLLLALGQALALTSADARVRGEAFWSPLTRRVVIAMMPALFIGATVTAYGVRTGQLDLLPPFWSLAYGASLFALGLYAGWRVQVVGVLFLLGGAVSLFAWKEFGLRTMAASFGGGHLLLGILIAWKPRASAA